MAVSFEIGQRRLAPGAAPYCLAEMACAHEGDPALAAKLIDLAAEARADGVQLQLFSVQALVSPHFETYPVFEKLTIPLDDWRRLIRRGKERGMHVWANVFDEEALAAAVEEDVDVLKLHSSDLSNPRMLTPAAHSGKPLSLAVGGSTLDEIGRAVTRLREEGAHNLLLMHGYQAFPTAPEDSRLAFIGTLERAFGCAVGYQDHTDGASELALILPLAALGVGACLLEKHITDNRAKQGTDYHAALDPETFGRFVTLAKQVHAAIGDGAARPLSEAERNYRRVMKKSIVAARGIEAGETIREDLLAFMRAGTGLTPDQAPALVGRRARRAIEAFTPVAFEDFDAADGG